MIVKICKVHGELSLSQTYIYKKSNRKECRICNREQAKKRYLNREIKEKYKHYHQANREKILLRKKLYYQNNKELSKLYYLINKEKIKLYNRLFYKDKKETIDERHRLHYKQNRKSVLLRHKEWKKNNKQLVNEQQKRATERLSRSYISKLMLPLKYNDIPQELIQVKRIHLLIKRKIKEKVNGNKKC